VKDMGRYDAKAHERDRVLTDDELRRIWQATEKPHPFHSLVRFVLLTGARRDEARYLPWSEINGSDWNLPARRNKVDEDLCRPLSQAAQDVLAGMPRIDNGRMVFSHDGTRGMGLTRPKRRLDAASGVSGWVLHDCRRTSRTLLSRAGINSDIAERCLGHVVGGVRGIYDRHKYQAEMAHAFEALARQIDRIVNPPADNIVAIR
jgi:integrase